MKQVLSPAVACISEIFFQISQNNADLTLLNNNTWTIIYTLLRNVQVRFRYLLFLFEMIELLELFFSVVNVWAYEFVVYKFLNYRPSFTQYVENVSFIKHYLRSDWIWMLTVRLTGNKPNKTKNRCFHCHSLVTSQWWSSVLWIHISLYSGSCFQWTKRLQ